MWIIVPEGYENRGVWLEDGRPHLSGPFLTEHAARTQLEHLKILYPKRKYVIRFVEDVPV